MLTETGVPTLKDIESVKPTIQRLKKGPVAMIECFQEIPCNPCSTSCPTEAITFKNINDLPTIDFDKCTGCGICVSVCPGLAIFIIDETYSDDKAIVKIPYEYLPVPKVNSEVDVTDRAGNIVGKGKVIKILNIKKKDGSSIVSVVVDKELSMIVRGFRIEEDLTKTGAKDE